MKFKFPAIGGNFKFQVQDSFLEYIFLEIWRFEKHIALSEKKPPLKCSVLHCQCELSIFPASLHQSYANILVFININPFLYINDQFALVNLYHQKLKFCKLLSFWL